MTPESCTWAGAGKAPLARKRCRCSNACVLKPAEEACLTALAFVPIAQQAGLPDIALNLVTGLGEEAGAALAAHPGVHHRPAPLAGSPTRQSVAPANGLEASSA